MDAVTIPQLAQELNDLAPGYRIGELRTMRCKLKRIAPRTKYPIFDPRNVKDEWAFHFGGRSELQFNIGLEDVDGTLYIRHGVAFALETSQFIHDIDDLVPKIGLFDEFVRANLESVSDFEMWRYKSERRSPKLPIGPIIGDWIEKGAFIFIGALQPVGSVDRNVILSDFDRLLPLYKFVETGGEIAPYRDSPPPFQFTPGHKARKPATIVRQIERELSVVLRHNALQDALVKELRQEFGDSNVGTEQGNGIGGRIDAVVKEEGGYTFYEIKVGLSAQSCIREAVGQLLEYSYWPGTQRARALVIVSEAPLDEQSGAYLKTLSSELAIPLSYRRVSAPLAKG